VAYGFTQQCTAGQTSCATSQGVAYANGGTGAALSDSTADANAGEAASATTSATSDNGLGGESGGGSPTNGVVYQNVTNADGTTTRKVVYNSGSSCVNTQAAATQAP
jgi:hypothetical protein